MSPGPGSPLRPVARRPAAERDIAEAAAYYALQGGLTLELDFIDALEASFDLIARHPASGSTRHSLLLPQLPTPLRFHRLKRFDRYLVYYLALPTHVEVIRVWDASRGLEALIQDTGPSD